MHGDLFPDATEPTAIDRSGRYPPLVQLLACAGISVGKARLGDLVRRAGLCAGGGRAYTSQSLMQEVQDWVEAGQIARDESGLACVAAHRSDAFREAALAGRLRAWYPALQNLFEHSGRRTWGLRSLPEAAAMTRVALCAGADRFSVQALGYDDAGRVYCSAFADPFDAKVFALLPARWRDSVAERMLTAMLAEPKPAARDLIAWTEEQSHSADANRGLHYRTCEHLLWQGRFDDARARLAADPSPYAAALNAGAAAMCRDWASARELFAVAYAELRTSEGRRYGLLPCSIGWLHAAALIAQDEPRALAEARRVCRGETRATNGRDSWLWMRLEWTVEARIGNRPAQSIPIELYGDNAAADLVSLVSSAWLRQTLPAPVQIKARRLCDAFAAAGYVWAAREVEAVLAICTDRTLSAPLAATVAATFAGERPWQRALAALAALAPEDDLAKAPETRLIWVIEHDAKSGAIAIAPWEQKRAPRGWGKGKPLPLARLAGSERFAPQDAPVRRALVKLGGSIYLLDPDQALPALVGHPRVYFADDLTTPVELTAGTPVLEVERRKNAFRLTVQPTLRTMLARRERDRAVYDAPAKRKSDPCLLVRETRTRARVVCVTAAHRRAAELIGTGLDVPAEGSADIDRAVAGAARFFHVHSDIAAGLPETPADATLRAELAPAGGGLQLRLAVRPLGDSGPRFAPGEGAVRVIAEVGGERRAAARDLKSERSGVARVLEACPMLGDDAHVHEWRIDDPESSLALVEALQGLTSTVQVEWPEGVKFRVTRPYRIDDFKIAIRSARNWFVAAGGLRLDEGLVVEMAELVEFARASGGRYVPLGEGGFVAVTEDLRRRIEELAALGDLGAEGVRIHPLAAAAIEEMTHGAQIEADGDWRARLERLREADALDPEPPSTLQAELRPYQLAGYKWLARLAHWGGGACLADDMGLGKTVQALALLASRSPGGPALVVAPTSVCPNWIEEARRFAPTLNARLFGAGDRAKRIDEVGALDLIVCSYALLQQEAERFSRRAWHTVVLDEAQAVKNYAAKRTQAVLALSADFRMVTTGTPVENRLDELWTLFQFLNPGLLGPRERFNERYAAPIERGRDARARARLRRLVRPFVLRRTKSEVLAELPPRTEITLTVEPDERERAFQEALRRSAVEAIEHAGEPVEQQRFRVLTELMRMRRACCDPRLVAPAAGIAGAKLDAFAEVVEELVTNRHKALVFSQFVDFLALLRARLEQMGVRYQYLDGGTPAAERGKRVAAFQAGEGEIFLISLRAGGFGLNLTAADYVIITDPWWNPAVEDQAAGRAHRIGQERPVTVYRLLAKDSIEERIMALHQDKRALAEGLFAGEEFAANVSVEELVQLIRGDG